MIDGGTARQEYVNLMRWQLGQVLGYGITHAVELHNEHGTPMYTMVFATDHKAGHKIMSHLYREAYPAYPQMRIDQRRQRERDLGVATLFEALGEADPTYEVADANYVHQPPGSSRAGPTRTRRLGPLEPSTERSEAAAPLRWGRT